MLIFNLNIRGLGGGTKARYLRRCISTEGEEFVCLQETKIVQVTEARCFSLWGIIISVGFIMVEIMVMEVFYLCGTKKLLITRAT